MIQIERKGICFLFLMTITFFQASGMERKYRVYANYDQYVSDTTNDTSSRKLLVVFTAFTSSVRVLEDLILLDTLVVDELNRSNIDVLFIQTDNRDTGVVEIKKKLGAENFPAYVLCTRELKKCSTLQNGINTNKDILRPKLLNTIKSDCSN